MPTLIYFLSFVFTVLPAQGLYTVTNDPQAVTFYTLEYEAYGTPAFLAHADKAGASFDDLTIGDEVMLVYPDDARKSFVVTEFLRYRATDPMSEWSYFVDLETGESFDSLALGRKIYKSGHGLVLQTCIEKDGNPNWGRLFVIAEPLVIDIGNPKVR
jgi:hypothetical protein